MTRAHLFAVAGTSLGLCAACGETFTSNVSTGGRGNPNFGGTVGGGAGGHTSTVTGGNAQGGDPGGGGRKESSSGGDAGSQGTSGAPAAIGCEALEFSAQERVADADTDVVLWYDAECKPRRAALARVGGGYLRQLSYELSGKTRTVTGTGAAGHQGWGYTTNHFGDTATIGQDGPGTFAVLFRGAHHLIYRYQSRPVIADQEVPVTQEWFFATGRSNPVLATSYDMTDLEPGSLVADTRTPYGDVAWNGDENAESTIVSGVAWGDRYKFTTTSEPLTMNSSWDYTEPNVVPYVLVWETSTNSEMGAVQTQTQVQHDAGGYWFYPNWGKTSDNQTRADGQVGEMTTSWNWTYQINQYELCIDDATCVDSTTSSHRLAWGANYGALGGNDEQGTYAAYGDDKFISGYPYQAYAVLMVLGPHQGGPTYEQVLEIERIQASQLSAKRGTVVTELPGGVNRTDLVTLEPKGYDPRYVTWNVEVDGGGGAEITLETEGADHPTFVFHALDTLPDRVLLNDVELVADSDYFASVDGEGARVFLTLNRVLTGSTRLALEPVGGP
jgi:hypothetical protein